MGAHDRNAGLDGLQRTRIAVVDDHPMFRAGVVQAFKERADIEIVGLGTTAEDAVRLTTREGPDVLLLGFDSPTGVLQALALLARTCPSTRAILLSFWENEDVLEQAMKFGVRGYGPKSIAAGELVRIVRVVRAGGTCLPPSAGRCSRPGLAAREETKADRDLPERRVPPRERQALESQLRPRDLKRNGTLRLGERRVTRVTGSLVRRRIQARVKAALLARQGGLLDT